MLTLVARRRLSFGGLVLPAAGFFGAPCADAGGAAGSGDECAVCVPVGDGVFAGNNCGSNEPDITSCTFADVATRWYCYTASCNGTATASTAGSGFDTALSAWDACGGTELACNDDFGGYQSEINWCVAAGATYFIRVSGFNTDCGDFVLDVGCESLPAGFVEFNEVLTGSGFTGGPGQSVTTPGGGPWEDIAFNFHDSVTGAPIAEGSLYVFDVEYTGTPQDLGPTAPGLLAVAPADGCSHSYVFPPSLVLSSNTQYFFYADTRPGGPGGVTTTGDGYAGGTYLDAPDGNGNFGAAPCCDASFSLQSRARQLPCPWDCGGDDDGNVGIADFLALLGQWGGPGACDFDGGGVGINDFLELLFNWGPCP